MAITIQSMDETGNDIYICKVCHKWVNAKEYHKSIRTCKECIRPYLKKKTFK